MKRDIDGHSGGSVVATLIERARSAQRVYEKYSQAEVDLVVEAVAWAILEPKRNRE